jgi:hypothetical protein
MVLKSELDDLKNKIAHNELELVQDINRVIINEMWHATDELDDR